MKNIFPLLICLSFALISQLSYAAEPTVQSTAQSQGTRRFALTVGANDGGQDLVRLRYANTDAQALGQVLVEMGGVQTRDHVLLAEPRAAELKKSIEQMRANIAAEQTRGRRTELIFYYSGHSNEDGLLLGSERVPYQQLRGWLTDIPADAKVVILDSCAAGAATRTKGGQRMPAFLSDQSGQAQGMAILTSSSDTEASQESDAIGASFFTYYLIAGLRGAADSTGDRRVTLNEAYRHAFDETLARTQRAMSGAQHPAYDIQMTGQSDLVLTELQQTNAVLHIDRSLQGRLFFRTQSDQRLVVEMTKHPGRPLEIGLPAAMYDVLLEHDDLVFQATAALRSGRTTRLTHADFQRVSKEKTRNRGESGKSSQNTVVFGFDLFPFVGMSSSDSLARRNFSLNLVGGISGGSNILEIGGALNIAREDVSGLQLSGAVNIVGGNLRGTQIAGALNVVQGDVEGAQIAPVNIARNIVGPQFGAINVTHDIQGPQFGAINITHDIQGPQFGAINITHDIHGPQFGAINLSNDVYGPQFGAINIANHVRGLQIGAINIAKSADVGIGAISIYTEGFLNIETFASDDGLLMAGIRHGSKSFYNTYSVGSRVMKNGKLGFAYGLSIGWRTQLSNNFEFSIDASATQVVDFDYGWSQAHSLQKIRPMLTWQLADSFALFAAPTLTLQFVGNGGEIFAPINHWELTHKASAAHLALWPGFTLGARFF